MELLLVRHALPIRVEDVEGPADPELSEAGHHQARHLADYLAFERVHAIYASPLRRAMQTAAPVAERQGVDVLVAEGIAEYDREASEYIPVEQMKAEGHPGWQDILLGGVHQSMGIDPYEFRKSVVGAVERIVADHPGEKAAAVCHGGVINAYLTHILGIEDPSGFFYPNYTSIHRVAAARSGERSVLTINETAHLRGTGLPIGLFGGS
jgi:probable phosphoglycerate mutase